MNPYQLNYMTFTSTRSQPYLLVYHSVLEPSLLLLESNTEHHLSITVFLLPPPLKSYNLSLRTKISICDDNLFHIK